MGLVNYTKNIPSQGLVLFGNLVIEDISNQITGSDQNFILAHKPVIGSVQLFWNGMRQKIGSTNDFIVANKDLTVFFKPKVGNALVVNYSI